jgi:hypothetical protein
MLIDSLSTLLLKFIDKERESVIADAIRPDNSTDDSRVRNFIVAENLMKSKVPEKVVFPRKIVWWLLEILFYQVLRNDYLLDFIIENFVGVGNKRLKT